jgi:DNA invertase Pin-like site-specific DNA recombinase
MKIGYAWVSVDDQHPDAQVHRLKAAGCERMYSDKGDGGRPQWDLCLEQLRKGDTLVVVHLDRLSGIGGSGIGGVLEIADDLMSRRGVKLRVMDRFIPEYRPEGSSFTRWWKRA